MRESVEAGAARFVRFVRFLRSLVRLVALPASLASLASPASAQENAPVFRASETAPALKEALVAHVDHRWAVTEHRQIMRSVVPGQTEGQYELTTPIGGVVTKFSYWNGDKEIPGELLERTDAVAMYDEVTRARRDPGVLEEVAPGRFRYRISPFAPSEAKRVEVRWESWLPAHGKV